MLLCGAAEASSLFDREERRADRLIMDQVRTGDYTYEVGPTGAITRRCDAAANRLRRSRDPRSLRFPEPCTERRPSRSR